MRTTHTYVDINYGGKENLGSGNSCSRWPPISRGHVKETLSHEKRSLKENYGILLLQAKGNRIRFRFGLFQRRKCQVRKIWLGAFKSSADFIWKSPFMLQSRRSSSYFVPLIVGHISEWWPNFELCQIFVLQAPLMSRCINTNSAHQKIFSLLCKCIYETALTLVSVTLWNACYNISYEAPLKYHISEIFCEFSTRFAKYKDWPIQILIIAFQPSQLFLTVPAVN